MPGGSLAIMLAMLKEVKVVSVSSWSCVWLYLKIVNAPTVYMCGAARVQLELKVCVRKRGCTRCTDLLGPYPRIRLLYACLRDGEF